MNLVSISIILAWVALIGVAVWFIPLAIALWKQKEEYFSGRNQMFYSYTNTIKKNPPKNVFFNAGEANIEFYEKIQELFQSDNNQEKKLEVVCGPKLSTYSSYKTTLLKEGTSNSWKPKEDISDKDVLKLHPLFYLKNEYPDRVSLYLKKTNNDNHFALIESGNAHYLYVEEPHFPLDEKGVLFITNPNKILWNKYKAKQEAITGEVMELKEINDFKKVEFAYFVDKQDFCAEVA